MITLIVSLNDANQTLINFIKKNFKKQSLSSIYKLFRTRKIKVNNKVIKDFKYLVQENDLVVVYSYHFEVNDVPIIVEQPQPQILFEDDNLLIVIKDHNLVVHSPYGTSLDSMVRFYLQQKQLLLTSSTFIISHQYRLDKLTKGLIIYPKTRIAQQILFAAQKEQQIIKKYLAIVEGQLLTTKIVAGFIYKDEQEQKMIFNINKTSTDAKSCTTIIKPLFNKDNFTLIECQLLSGRKHQIRATLASLNFPIVGDYKYNSTITTNNKIALFAYFLSFKSLKAPLNYLNKQQFIIKDLKIYLIEKIKNKKW